MQTLLEAIMTVGNGSLSKGEKFLGSSTFTFYAELLLIQIPLRSLRPYLQVQQHFSQMHLLPSMGNVFCEANLQGYITAEVNVAILEREYSTFLWGWDGGWVGFIPQCVCAPVVTGAVFAPQWNLPAVFFADHAWQVH